MEHSSFGNDGGGMKSRVHAKLALCLTLPLWATSACTGFTDPTLTTEEQFGSMEITVTTTGTNQDADGYTVSINEGTLQTVGINGTATFSPILVGDYQVELQGVAANCVVEGPNPKNVQVTVDTTTENFFVIECT